MRINRNVIALVLATILTAFCTGCVVTPSQETETGEEMMKREELFDFETTCLVARETAQAYLVHVHPGTPIKEMFQHLGRAHRYIHWPNGEAVHTLVWSFSEGGAVLVGVECPDLSLEDPEEVFLKTLYEKGIVKSIEIVD